MLKPTIFPRNFRSTRHSFFLLLSWQCQRCAALYNDKPFRSGDQLQPMNCRPCHCHGHALSCHYDATADDQPDEHYQGGGGFCDNCMHNTAGILQHLNELLLESQCQCTVTPVWVHSSWLSLPNQQQWCNNNDNNNKNSHTNSEVLMHFAYFC